MLLHYCHQLFSQMGQSQHFSSTRSRFQAEPGTLTLMHQSFVTTAPPPTGKDRDYDFSFQCPAISPPPPPQGGKLEVKTLLFAPPFTTEHLPGVSILMSKPCHIPYVTAGTLEKQLPRTIARLSPTLIG